MINMYMLLLVIGYAIVYITAGNPSLYTLKWLMVTLGFFLIYFAGRMSKKTF